MIRMRINTVLGAVCLLLLALAMLLGSCGTLRKNSQYLKENRDSVKVTRQDSGHLQRQDTATRHLDQQVTKKDSSGQYQRKITIELDPDGYQPGEGNVNAADYCPPDTASPGKKKKPVYLVIPDPGSGKPITVDFGLYKPSRILIEETGSSRKVDSSGRTMIDSSGRSMVDSSGRSMADSVSDKTVKNQGSSSKYRNGTPALLFSIALLLGVIWLMFFRKKRN